MTEHTRTFTIIGYADVTELAHEFGEDGYPLRVYSTREEYYRHTGFAKDDDVYYPVRLSFTYELEVSPPDGPQDTPEWLSDLSPGD